MKKIIFALIFMIASVSVMGQLPYSKILYYNQEDFSANKFKYDKKRNQMILNKSNGLNNTSNILSALNGTNADIRPHKDDYRMTVQFGQRGPAYLNVLFYDDDRFLNIQDWMLKNNIDFKEMTSGRRTIQQFSVDGYDVEISIEKVSSTATTTATFSANAKTFDDSYNIYNYTIITGIPPMSEAITKDNQKRQKRRNGNGKKDMEDLF